MITLILTYRITFRLTELDLANLRFVLKAIALFVQLIFLMTTNLTAQTNPSTGKKEFANMKSETISNEEWQILQVTRKLTDLMIARKTAEISTIVDSNFTLTHITGYVQSKKDWFAEIDSESMKYYSYQEVKTSVKTDGDKAIFIGQNLLDARIWGSRNTWRLQQIMHLEKRNGRWIILKSVASIF